MTTNLLRDLGVLGWRDREPAIVAALAAEVPLLLVGPHGTAKSMLLERLAGALGCTFRHYNASSLNFDDLVGFPVPDGDRVRYLRTPLDAWDAEAIFLDEISRCRLDMQNRLFPLVHERRLQGTRLERLRHRWAAMNPPADAAGDASSVYAGCEPLDTALADRFAWIVATPEPPSGVDRVALIRGPAVVAGAEQRLRDAVCSTRAMLRTTEAARGEEVARYVDVAADALAQAGNRLSGRRLRTLYENVVSVLATGLLPELRDAAFLALRHSLPMTAGAGIEAPRVLAAHRAAMHFLVDPGDPLRRRILGTVSPLARIALALDSPDDALLGATLLDAMASVGQAGRLAIACRLFERLARERPGLPAIVFEAMARELGRLEQVGTPAGLPEHEPDRSTRRVLQSLASAGDPGETWIHDVVAAATAGAEPVDARGAEAEAREVACHLG